MDVAEFLARHRGICGMCGEVFEPGEIVVLYSPTKVFVHGMCDWMFDWSTCQPRKR